MSLEFPGGPLKCVKKNQKCLSTEKKIISSILIIFGVKVPPMEKLGNPKFFCSRIPSGVLWAFQILAFLAHLQFLNDHILASTNDRRLVLVSNIKFWNELSEKIHELFFGPNLLSFVDAKIWSFQGRF